MLCGCSASQNEEASNQVQYWSQRLNKEVPSSTFDTEVIEWGKTNGLLFEFVSPSALGYKAGEHLLAAKLGRFKVSGFDCAYHDLYAYVWLDQFKNSSSLSVERKEICE